MIIPSADVARCDDCLTGSPEEAREIEALVARCLKTFAELHYDDIGHGVAVL